jgi:hypothetical protein
VVVDWPEIIAQSLEVLLGFACACFIILGRRVRRWEVPQEGVTDGCHVQTSSDEALAPALIVALKALGDARRSELVPS